MIFEPLRSTSDSMQKQVASVIKNAIISGELKPGDKLPSERELAEMLHVSRGSLREALVHLQAANLVQIKHGKGVFISNSDQDSIIAGFAKQLAPDEGKIKELFEFRLLVEPQSAAWAAERCEISIIEEMNELLQSVKDKINSLSTGQLAILAEHDKKFHLFVAEASGNSMVTQVMNNLMEALSESRAKAMIIPGRAIKSLNEHILIAQAITKGDAVAAEEEMKKHLHEVAKDIIPNYGVDKKKGNGSLENQKNY